MKTITIKNEKYNVEDKVHDLLCYYSNTVQVAELVRQAQKDYYRKQDQTTLRKAKALEKRLDDLLNGKENINEQNLFR